MFLWVPMALRVPSGTCGAGSHGGAHSPGFSARGSGGCQLAQGFAGASAPACLWVGTHWPPEGTEKVQASIPEPWEGGMDGQVPDHHVGVAGAPGVLGQPLVYGPRCRVEDLVR